MKIGVFEPFPQYGGGSERVSFDFARTAASYGHTVQLFYDMEGSMVPDYKLFCERVTRFHLPCFGWRTFFQSIVNAWKFAQKLRKDGIECVFCSHFPHIRILAISSFFHRIPIVFHLGVPDSGSSLFKRFLYRRIALGISPSEHTGETWTRSGWPPNRLKVIANGVDTNHFSEGQPIHDIREKLKIPLEAKFIVYVGRLVREKGISPLIEAFVRLAKIDKSYYLGIVGESPGGGFAPWDAAFPDDIRDRVVFFGRVDETSLFYQAADVVVIPSVWDEPFGLTLVEAMSCQSIVVASRTKSFLTIGAGCEGVLFADRDSPESLANAIVQALKIRPETRLALRFENRKRVLNHFSLEKFASLYLDAITAVQRI